MLTLLLITFGSAIAHIGWPVMRKERAERIPLFHSHLCAYLGKPCGHPAYRTPAMLDSIARSMHDDSLAAFRERTAR